MRFRRILLCTASVALFSSATFAQTAQQDTFPYPPTPNLRPNAAQLPQQPQRLNNFNRGPVDPRRDYIGGASGGQGGVQASGRSLNDYRAQAPAPRTYTGQQPPQGYPPAQPGQPPQGGYPEQGAYPPQGGANPSQLPPASLPVQDGEYMAHEKARQFNARQETERLRLKCSGGDKRSCDAMRQAGQPVIAPQRPMAPDPRQYRMPPGGVASPQGYGVAPAMPVDQPGYSNPPQPQGQGYYGGQPGGQEYIPPQQPSPPPSRQPNNMPRYYQDLNGRVHHDPIPMEQQQGR